MHQQNITHSNFNLLNFRSDATQNLISYEITSLRSLRQFDNLLKPKRHDILKQYKQNMLFRTSHKKIFAIIRNFEYQVSSFQQLHVSMLLICLQYLLKMDYKAMLEQIKLQKPLPERTVKSICKKVQQIFTQQSNLLRISAPICVIGDVHGQFFDVLKLFSLAGEVPDTKYVFIGDYVDRGYNSLETILYLFILKIMHPDRIYLTRGNHESRQISCMYGFQDQINKKYGHTGVWKICNETFDYLPLSAVIDDQIFCVHGGLSPDIHALDQIKEIDRVIQIPTQGPFADLMWSDPEEIQTWTQGHRGAGWQFGHRVVTQFNYHNNLKLIARAHQLAQQGFCEWFAKKNLVTVWSAPNYCYRCNNLASYMKVNEQLEHNFVIYDEDPRSGSSQDYKLLIPYFL